MLTENERQVQEKSIAIWAPISDYAKFSAALPKPTCVTVHSPDWCQVCLWADLTSLLSCLSRQGSKRARSCSPYVGALWLVGLLCADWLRLQHYFVLPFLENYEGLRNKWIVKSNSDGRKQKLQVLINFRFFVGGPFQREKCEILSIRCQNVFKVCWA